MNIRTRLALCSLLAAVGLAAACTTEDVSNADECTPNEEQACTCEDTGAQGTQTCNAVGTGFSDCSCGVEGGSGGSGGEAVGGAGGESGGTGGASGGTGGAGGGDMDASAPDSSTPMDGGGDAEALSPCNTCLVDNCTDELLACSGDPCIEETGDAGLTESDCMFFCLDDAAVPSDAGADGGSDGVVDSADLADCAAFCGVGTDGGTAVSAATEALFACMLGAGGDAGTNCRADCGY